MRYGELVRSVSRFAVVALLGGMAAACSSDTVRFSEAPFANPFAAKEADPPATGGIETAARMPRSSVQSAALAPPATRTTSAAPGYNRPAAPSQSARALPTSTGPGGWSAEGGTAITVASGDTLAGISDRYGVPPKAILATNGLTANTVKPGTRIVIPVYNANGSTMAQAAPAQRAPEPVRIARAPAPTPAKDVAAARVKVAETPRPASPPAPVRRSPAAEAPAILPVDRSARVKLGQPAAATPPTPGAQKAREPVAPARVAKVDPKPAPASGKVVKTEPAQPKVAKAEPAKPAKPEPHKIAVSKPTTPARATEPAKTADAAKPREPEATGALPSQPAAPAPSSADFRWPARGRVISGFGGGSSNEGINIAVPDGTPVKAADSGTVAYAGSEVKGYGNLVLIRHDNGYVSAYAHNGEIDVKRGQKVGRGQTIAKSGQSGNVTSPQLHFEIRKGSTPVDPMQYLASN